MPPPLSAAPPLPSLPQLLQPALNRRFLHCGLHPRRRYCSYHCRFCWLCRHRQLPRHCQQCTNGPPTPPPWPRAFSADSFLNIFENVAKKLYPGMQGCGTGKFEDGSGPDILPDYGSGSYTCIYIYMYEYV